VTQHPPIHHQLEKTHVDETQLSPHGDLVGWSEPSATSAPARDAAVQAVSG